MKIAKFTIIISSAVLILMGCSINKQSSITDGMVYIPGGTFQMGSNEGQDDEQPVHTVTLSPYWIDSTEVTNAMYEQCVQDEVCDPPFNTSSYTHDNYYGDRKYDNFPVISVSWYDAKAYCEWAGKQLPTEAQWEFAARGTDGRMYPWGDSSPSCSMANYRGCAGETVTVGSYESGKSPYGVYDMEGNVGEWMADWYGIYPASSQTDPTGPASGEYRVLRGSSWGDFEHNIHSSSRKWFSPDDKFIYLGFRCSLTP